MKKSIFVLLAAVVFLAAGFAFASPVFGASTDAPTRVWVEYQRGGNAAVQAALNQAGAKFHYHFADLDAFVVTVPENALRGLKNHPQVAGVEIDPIRELDSAIPSTTVEDASPYEEQVIPYGIDMVQARDIWDANRDGKIDKKAPTGAGRTVCVIDTGTFDGHEDFAGVEFIGGYSQTNEDPDQWNFDGHGHGTHVAGTVGAAFNDIGVVGVSPGDVSFFIVKIFGDDGLWVSQHHASNLVAAANECADNGANVISMSLSGPNPTRYEERAFNDLYAAGVLSVAAASNGGIADYRFPASYDSVISVAAIDETYTVADFSQFNDQVELAAPGVGVLSSVPFLATDIIEVDGVAYSGGHIEYSAYGTASGELVDGGLCTSTGDWAGYVVLCERGDISFYDKVMNVQNSGGTAAVIYNNAPGNFLGTLGDGNSSEIIAISLSQEDGQYLVANKLGFTGEITSNVIWNVSGYEAWGGTSMATPHVSGVAALIWSWNPNLTNVEIREAMVATAMDLGDPGKDVYYGYGLVQAYDAWQYLGGGKPGKGPK